MIKSYSFFEKRWLFTTILLKLSVVWFSLILNFFGNGWLIEKSNGKFVVVKDSRVQSRVA